MRPFDLPPVEKLGAQKPHGHKMRYMAGCRCKRCRDGNARYEAKMQEDRERFGPNGLVSTEKVHAHLIWLQKNGMGPVSIGKAAEVGKTTLRDILYYGKRLMRRRPANRVLAVRPTLENLPKTHNIPAAETLEQIRQLTSWGIPYLTISHDALGNRAPLQIKALKKTTKTVTVKTALRIREYFGRVERMRAIWASLGRTIPRRHYVYWKDGRHGLTVRSFELRPFHVGYDFYYVYPPELKAVIGMASQLKHQIRGMRNAA